MILSIVMAIGLACGLFPNVVQNVESADKLEQFQRSTGYGTAERVEQCQLKEFESVEVLEEWLERDSVSKTRYLIIGEEGLYPADCDDIAMHLVDAAREDGYDLHFEVDEGDGKVGHALCLAIIGNEFYYIEPQTDEVTRIGRLD